MRRILPGDVDALAAALVMPGQADPAVMSARARAIIEQAETADRYVRRFGRVHPRWGDGSLLSASLKHSDGCRSPALGTAEGLAALAVAAGALAQWKTAERRFSRPRRTHNA